MAKQLEMNLGEIPRCCDSCEYQTFSPLGDVPFYCWECAKSSLRGGPDLPFWAPRIHYEEEVGRKLKETWDDDDE